MIAVSVDASPVRPVWRLRLIALDASHSDRHLWPTRSALHRAGLATLLTCPLKHEYYPAIAHIE
jgi:hypothetical protein